MRVRKIRTNGAIWKAGRHQRSDTEDIHFFTFVVKSKYESEINEIESNEYVLSQSDVLPSICEIGKNIEENKMTSRITDNNISMITGRLYSNAYTHGPVSPSIRL